MKSLKSLRSLLQTNKLILLVPFLSAVLLTLSYHQAKFRWFIFTALIPLFYFLDRVSPKAAFWFSWASGFLFLGWNISWFFDVLPAKWAGIENPVIGFVVVGLLWLLGAVALSIFIGFFGYGWHKVQSQKILFAPALWIVLEYSRAFFLSILGVGDDSLIGPHWTFGNLGYAFSNFPTLLQSSKLFGLYGAGFVIVFFNIILYKILCPMAVGLSKKPAWQEIKFLTRGSVQKNLREILVSLTLILFFAYYGAKKLATTDAPQNTHRIALIQTDLPTNSPHELEDFIKYTNQELDLLKNAALFDPDLVVLPEGSRLSLRFGENTQDIFALIFGGNKPTKIIDNARLILGGPAPARIFYYDTYRGLIALKDKKSIIPGGEYLPYILELPARIMGLDDWFKYYRQERAISFSREDPIPGFGAEKEAEGAILCSIFAPSLWRELSSGSAEILVNSSSQSLLRGSSAFYEQAENIIKFFAASNDRWFVQAANGGFSYAIDNRGFVIKRTEKLENTVLIAEAEYKKTKPPYVKFGDWPVFISFFALFIYFFREYLSTATPRTTYSIIKAWLFGR